MLTFRFVKAQPNTYLIQYVNGKIKRQGSGLSFFYHAPRTSLVSVSLASMDVPFIFSETTADYQEVSIQGQLTYRIGEPLKLTALMNFTLAANNRGYASDDPEKLPQRIVNQAQVLMRNEIQKLDLRTALQSAERIVGNVRRNLAASELVAQLGIEILALSVLAVKPSPETARALEAEVREQMLREADQAVYHRRNAAVEQERAIKENELNTEVAVENKKRQIREARIDADRAVQEKKQVMREDDMRGRIILEEENRKLVALEADNQKQGADAQAYGMQALMDTFTSVDPKVVQALAIAGMAPSQLIATAFQNLAENADRIGNLNITPDLLQQLMSAADSPSAPANSPVMAPEGI